MHRILLLAVFAALPMFAQQLDIKSFGAKCNGSDDTGAVQNALNALQNNGTLNVSCMASIGQVSVRDKANVTIQGTNGGGFRLLKQTGDDWARAFSVTSCSSCTIKDLVFAGNNKNMVPFGIDESANTTVQGLTIRNVPGKAANAFVTMHNSGNKYLNNHFENIGLDFDPGTQNAARAMWIGNVSDFTKETNVTVSGNTFDGISGTAIAVHGSGITVTNNHGTKLNWTCIKVLPLGGSGSTLIANNECSGAGAQHRAGGGIMTEYYNSSNEQTVIRDNILEGYAAADVARGTDFIAANVGINIANPPSKMTRNVQILHNTIRNFWYDAIQVTGPTDNFRIEGNKIERTVSTGTQWVGINLHGDQGKRITNGVIRKNMIRGKFDCIQANINDGGTIDGLVIEGNSCVGMDRDGLHVEMYSGGGTARNINPSGNCFAGIRGSVVWDNRRSPLPAIPMSGSCPDPTTGTNPDPTPTPEPKPNPDPKDQRIAELEAQVSEQQSQLSNKETLIVQLQHQIDALKAFVAQTATALLQAVQ